MSPCASGLLVDRSHELESHSSKARFSSDYRVLANLTAVGPATQHGKKLPLETGGCMKLFSALCVFGNEKK